MITKETQQNQDGKGTSNGMKLLIFTQKVDSADDNLGFFQRWIEEFARRCEEVIVICLYEGQHSLPANVRVLSLGKEGGVSRLKYLYRFYSYIWGEQKHYDSVFVHMNQIYVILGGVLWRLLGKRIGLWYAHGTVNTMLRLAMLFVHDAFTSTSQSLRIESRKRRIIGHGIDTDLFTLQTKVPTAIPFSILSVGRISPVKDYETLIEATKILREANISLSVKILGTTGAGRQGCYFEELLHKVEDYGLADVVHFVGASLYKDMPSQLSLAHVLVNTSGTGSLDKAPLEAMAMGIPVLTCNEGVVHALPNSLREELSFPPHDAHTLAEKLIFLSQESSEERILRGRILRDVVVKNHALPHLADTIIAVLSS